MQCENLKALYYLSVIDLEQRIILWSTQTESSITDINICIGDHALASTIRD